MRLIDAVRNAPLFELMVITGGLVNDFRSAPEKNHMVFETRSKIFTLLALVIRIFNSKYFI